MTKQGIEPQDLVVNAHISHARRGGDYTFLGWATFQADQETHRDYDGMAVYLSEDGLLCTRPHDELIDGRFTAIDPTAPSPWETLLASIRTASPDALPALLDRAEQLARRSVVLDDNALLWGREAFDEARRRGKAEVPRP